MQKAARNLGGRPKGAPTTLVRLPIPIATVARRVAGSALSFGSINAFFDVEASTTATVPLMTAKAECGFPSPADDYLDRPLDFNELLIQNAPATFAVRVAGDSMTGIGIFPGDIAVVNRAKRPVDKSIVLALVDGEFTLKRYRKRGARIWLHRENPAFRDIEILDGMAFEIWGVVTSSIRML